MNSEFESARAAPPGTNMTVGVCHGGRPFFPPPPRAWPVMLGAADLPIGCALNFLQTRRATKKWPGTNPGHEDHSRNEISSLKRRLAFDRLALALPRLAAEEQRLA